VDEASGQRLPNQDVAILLLSSDHKAAASRQGIPIGRRRKMLQDRSGGTWKLAMQPDAEPKPDAPRGEPEEAFEMAHELVPCQRICLTV
jgi:hypothetical protein